MWDMYFLTLSASVLANFIQNQDLFSGQMHNVRINFTWRHSVFNNWIEVKVQLGEREKKHYVQVEAGIW